MSFTRVKPTGWAFGEQLTSAHMNTLDTDHSNSIDKRNGALEIDSISVTRIVPNNFDQIDGDWGRDATNGAWFVNTVGTVAPLTLKLNFRLPAGATLTNAQIYIKGGSGHAALPANMPVLRVVRNDLDTGTLHTIVSSFTDASPNVASFEVYHAVGGNLTLVSAPTINDYYLWFESEYGTNEQPNLDVYGARIIFTATRLDEW